MLVMQFLQVLSVALLATTKCDVTFRVVEAVMKHFHSSCVHIVQPKSDLQNEAYAVDLNKALRIPVSTVLIQDLAEKYSQLLNSNIRPLFVIHNKNNGTDTLKFLHQIQLSRGIWLLSADSTKGIDDLDIPIDCEFLVVNHEANRVVLTEVYRVSPLHPLEYHNFSIWNSDVILHNSARGIYQRRNNLKGVIFKAGIIDDFFAKVTKEVNKSIKFDGYSEDVWNVLVQLLHFRTEYYPQPENKYGRDLGNGSWNGLVGQVMNHQSHISYSALTWNSDRSKVVDFIGPLFITRDHLFIKKSGDTELAWNAFLKPFSTEIWLCLTLIIIMSSIVMLLMNKMWKCIYGTKLTTRFIDVLLQSLGVFCYQGESGNRICSYNRMLMFTVNVTAVVVMTCYSAFLISYISNKKYQLPFHNLEEFLNDGSYTMGIIPHSATYSVFKNSDGYILRKTYGRYLADEMSLPGSFQEAADWICEKRKYTVVLPENFGRTRYGVFKCNAQIIPEPLNSYHTGFLVQKNSPYKGLLMHKLNDMRSVGILTALWNRYTRKKKTHRRREKFTSVSLRQIKVMFVVLAAGAAISILILDTPIVELENEDWVRDVEFLTDICEHLNHFNCRLRGKDKDIVDAYSDIKAFLGCLDLWKSQLLQKEFHFKGLKSLNNIFNQKSEQYCNLLEKLKIIHSFKHFT